SQIPPTRRAFPRPYCVPDKSIQKKPSSYFACLKKSENNFVKFKLFAPHRDPGSDNVAARCVRVGGRGDCRGGEVGRHQDRDLQAGTASEQGERYRGGGTAFLPRPLREAR